MPSLDEDTATTQPPAYWLEVSVATDGEAAEAVAEALQPFTENRGVVLEQLGDAHDLDPYALEPEITVKIYLPGEQDTPELRQRIAELLYYLGRLYPIPEPRFRKLEDKDWAHAWKEHYHPFRVGRRLWIQPSWVENNVADPDDLVLTLDPGMAFGTGLHPTTQMCLQAVERLAKPGMQVLDVGTGSGILAIAAAKLEAQHVLGIDNDRQAVGAARGNATLNNIEDRITIREGTLESVDRDTFHLVLVNILAPVIVRLLNENALLDYVGREGKLVLSGIIDEQLPEVEAALARAGGKVEEMLSVRDWVTLICTHRVTETLRAGS